jgi:predicted nucleic-acid-binding protein
VRGIDTNVLVRHLVADNEEQTNQVERLFAASKSGREPVYVSCLVLCETAWVLRSVYGQSRADIAFHLGRVLDADIFTIEEEDCVRVALRLCQTGKGSFADHLIGQLNLARGCRVTVTFDRELRSDPAFSVL